MTSAGSTVIRVSISRLATRISTSNRSAYAERIRRRCRVKCPSSMKSASAACSIGWRDAVDRALHLHESVDVLGRNNQVAKPQRGKQRLAERADVEHATRRVESLKRRE